MVSLLTVFTKVRGSGGEGPIRGGGGVLDYFGRGRALVRGRRHLRVFELERLVEEIRYL